MPLVPLQQILAKARSDGYAVGYFEAWDACSLEAVLTAAEEESAPVILGFGAMMVDGKWLDGGGVEVLGAIGRRYAARSSVDVALIFNEAHTLDQAKRGIDAGFNAVMIDTHSWPTEDAIVAVKELCRVAHQSGVAVEGELGSPAEATASGVDHSHASLTDPDEAARFVEETGVDCLAVSVGNVHIMMDAGGVDRHGAPARDPQAGRRAAGHPRWNELPVSGRGAGDRARASRSSMSVRYSSTSSGAGLETGVGSAGTHPDVHKLLGSHKDSDVMRIAQERMTAKVRSLIKQYGGSGRQVTAAEVAAR